MILKFIRYLKGYVTLRLTGGFTERFINICMARGIDVWNIKKPAGNEMRVCIGIKDFFKIRTVAKKSRTRVKILEKRGLFAELRAHKRRKFFFAGLIFFLVFVFVMSRFVWHIEIHGLTYTPKEQILAALREEGVYPGALKSRLDQMKIKDNILLKEDSLTWIWVDLKGSKAIVNVSQRRLAPELDNTNAPQDIIAAKDGVIFSYTATGGTAKIKEGDSVLAGQLLISGVVTSEIIPYRYTKATGEVWARTWYTKQEVFTPEIYPLLETGESKTYRTLNLFGFDINLFLKDNPPYDTYEQIPFENELVLFGRTTGITLKGVTYKKTAPEKKVLSEKELLEYAKGVLLEKITPEVGEQSELLGTTVTHIKNQNGSYNITLTAEFKEQIGIASPIYISEDENAR